ncbi:MAG: c-type cytochrome [Mangrovibacterium sp.]
MNLKNEICIVMIFLSVIILTSCDRNRNTTGWQYFDDMVTSPAYETYTPNSNFPDGKTMQPPVEGTIPRGDMKYPYEKNDSDRAKAGITIKNPLEPTSQNIERGKKVYTVYCSSCHGDQGDGQGQLFTSKKYPYPPANLLSDKMRNVSDGEIYHVITVGWGIMAEHGSIIRSEDRWKAVLYIRNELQKKSRVASNE